MLSKRGLRRELRKRDAEIELLEQALRIARHSVEDQREQKHEWQARAERFSNDRVAAAQQMASAKLTIAQQQFQLAAWSSIAIAQAERHGRLLRAVVRHRAELAALQRLSEAEDRRLVQRAGATRQDIVAVAS